MHPLTYVEEEDDPVDSEACIDVETDAVEGHSDGCDDHTRLQSDQVDQGAGGECDDAGGSIIQCVGDVGDIRSAQPASSEVADGVLDGRARKRNAAESAWKRISQVNGLLSVMVK